MKGQPTIFRSNKKVGLTKGAKRVFAEVKPMLQENGGAAKLDYAQLTAQFGCSRFTISKWLIQIVDAGFIRRLEPGCFELVERKSRSVPAPLPAVLADQFIRPIPKHRLMAGR